MPQIPHKISLLRHSILYLPKYSRKGASSRLRSFQYILFFEKEEYTVTVSSLFNDQYLNELYSRRKIDLVNVFLCYWKRFRRLFRVRQYDIIIIEKEIFPYLPSWFDWLICKLGRRVWVDYDDAIFHYYDDNSLWPVRFFMGRKIDRVMGYADMVFVGSKYIGDRARKAGSKKTIYFPTVLNLDKYSLRSSKGSGSVVIGWIGTPKTQKYLKPILRHLEIVYELCDFKLLLVGGIDEGGYKGSLDILEWSESTEVFSIQKMDIGIMPLPDNPWERGKCAYKLIQYMACGIPVVASPVGMNREVVTHGKNGYLAETGEEWVKYLIHLLHSPELREQMGREGRALVEREYTLSHNFEKLRRALLED